MDLFISRNFPPCPHIGDHLFHQADSLSAWYLYWLAEPDKHTETFQILARIKRVAEFSIQGNYLSSSQEKSACEVLASAQNIPRDELHDRLKEVLSELTQDYPVAKIIDQMTELQQKIDLPAPIAQKILEGVRSDLPDINARAIIVYLAKILEEPAKALKGLPQVLTWLKA